MFDLNRLLRARSSRPAVDFNAMLSWKLLRGSHEFPGPDGGTCISKFWLRRYCTICMKPPIASSGVS